MNLSSSSDIVANRKLPTKATTNMLRWDKDEDYTDNHRQSHHHLVDFAFSPDGSKISCSQQQQRSNGINYTTNSEQPANSSISI